MSSETKPTGGYDPHAFEEKWYAEWVEKGYFHADPTSAKPPFSIVIPPPNVTGSLHMGHALNNTLQDILIRWKRMQGFEALWMPGTDHAGIATQNVVERKLAAEGTAREDTRARGVRRARLGVEGGVRRHHHPAAQAAGRLLRLGARALHHGRGACRARCARSSAASTTKG